MKERQRDGGRERDDAGSEGEPERGYKTCLRNRKMSTAQGTEVGRRAGVKGKEMDGEGEDK